MRSSLRLLPALAACLSLMQATRAYSASAHATAPMAASPLSLATDAAAVAGGCPHLLRFDPAGDEDPLDAFQRWRAANRVNLPVLPAVQEAHDRWARLHGQGPGDSAAPSEGAVAEALQTGPNMCPAGGLPAYQGCVCIAVNPKNVLQVVAGALSLQQSPAAGCASPTGGTSKTYGPEALYASSDGGQTWTASCGPWPSEATGGCTAPVGGGKAFLGADMGLAWDAGGNVYAVYTLLSAAWDLTYNLTCHSSALVLARSTTGGLSWTALGTIVNDLASATTFDNKALLAIDTTLGKAHSHTNRLYVVWDQNSVERLAYSDTGASGSWTTVVLDAAATANCPAGSTCNSGGNLAVGPDGTVYAVWNRLVQGAGGNQNGEQTVFSKSLDGGATWSAPSTLSSHQLLSFGSNYKVPAQDKRGVNAFAAFGVDTSGGAYGGSLYTAFSDFPQGTSTGPDLDTYLVRSTDGGATWSAPARVNDDPAGATQFLPWLSVDPATGGVNLAWYDTRNDPNDRKAQVFFSRSTDGGATFSSNLKVSQPSSAFSNAFVDYSDENSTDNANYGANQYGDYLQVAALDDIAYVGWTDTRQVYPVSGSGRAEDAATAVICSSGPGAPSGLGAVASSPNQVVLNWSAGAPAGATYKVYRAVGSCASGPLYTLLASGLSATTYTDATTSGGLTYSYQVSAYTAPCESARGACAQVTTPCPTPPDFPGLSSVTNPAGVTCTLVLSWPLALPYCGGPVVYNVYRSTSPLFVPTSAHRLAASVLDNSYSDSQGLVSGTIYYYVVRAVDQGNGVEDGNTTVKSGAPTGPYSPGTWTDDAGDTGPARMALTAPWTVGVTGGHSGPGVYNTGPYTNNLCAAMVTPPIQLGASAQLSFWSRYDIETGRDKGLVEASTDGGSTWQRVPVNYPDTAIHTGDACGYPATGTCFSHSFATPAYAPYTAPLGAWDNQTVLLRWNLSTNGSTTGAGWWVDDISITNVLVPGTCVAGPGCSPPSPPTLNAVTGGCSGVALNWTAGAGLTASFNVYRAPACGGAATRINGSPLTGTTYTDATAAPGQTYAYVVRGACDAGGLGESNDSNCLTGSTLKPRPPSAPAFGSVTCTSMGVTWPAVAGADGYDLYRATGSCGAPASAIAVGLASTTFPDSSLTPGATYSYYVVARAGSCSSDPGACAAQTTGAPLAAPTGLLATGACAGNTVSWDPVPGASSYTLYRGAACSTADATLSNATSPYIDASAPAGTSYYWVAAVGACGVGTSSGCVSATRPVAPPPPSGVTAVGSCSGVSVSWNPVAGASSYTVFRGAVCGAAVATFAGVTSPYADSTATAGTPYQYWVGASTTCGDTGPSACASAARPAAVQTPAAPAAGPVTCSSMALSWPAASGVATYDLYRAAGGCSGPATVAASGLTATSFTDTGLAAGSRYGYYLVAHGACEDSATGPCAEATTAARPTITAQPLGQAVPPGQSATLSVTATGAPPLAYQWYTGVSGDTSSPVGGATQSTYTTPPLASDLSLWVRVTNACGHADSLAATVGPCSPSCSANASVSRGTAPLTVSFSATGSPSSPDCGSALTFDWDFGDGTAHSNLQAPQHTYAAPGTYTWSVIVAVGGLACSKAGSVTAWAPLTTSISADPVNGTAPFTTSFVSSVSGGDGQYTYAWAFGDGGAATAQSPSHTYTTPGAYSASLVVSDGSGHTATSNTLAMTVTAPLSVAISGSPRGTGDLVPMTYDFSAAADGGVGPYSYAWSFGDGGIASGSNPSHAFTAGGTWAVSCAVTDSASHSSVSNIVTVTLFAPVTVTATATPGAAVPGRTVSFAVSGAGGDGHYAYTWAFGDGATASGSSVSHAYASPGSYTATVSVTDTASHSGSGSVPVTIWPPLAVSIAHTAGVGDTVPQTYGFAATAQGGSGTYSYDWSFGDGGTGTGVAPTHTFTTPGTWSVSCTVTDGGSNTAASNVLAFTFYNPLVLTCSGTPNPVILGNAVGFSAVVTGGSGLYAYAWDFGDGASGTGASPSHTYAATGTFPARVTVIDSANHTAACDVPVVVRPVPPQITAVQKVAAPLRLKVTGSGFKAGCAATIDGATVTVKFKTASSLVLKNLGALVPKGRTVQIVVTNPDGGASDPFPYTR